MSIKNMVVSRSCSSPRNTIASYRSITKKKIVFLCLLLGILLITILIGLAVGASSLDLSSVFSALMREDGLARSIVVELRLPRITVAVLAGWGLALSGAVTQAILRNPLASPFTLGVASGAGFGAVLGILMGHGLHQWLIASSAFGFALLTSFFILLVAQLKNVSSETMILAGVATMFFFSSLTSFVQYLGTMEEVHEITFWFFGSLSRAGWQEIGVALLMIAPPTPLLMKWAWSFNALMAGDESAKTLGVNVWRIRLGGILLASLITAGAICFTGIIGFVGLVAPHIARMLVGSDHRFLLPTSVLLGAILVVNADTLSRTLWVPQVIPIGIVTSFLGVPFFFYLLMKRRRDYW